MVTNIGLLYKINNGGYDEKISKKSCSYNKRKYL